MADGFEVKGMEALHAKLKDLSGPALVRATNKALRAGAVIVQAEITERAPVNATGGGTLPEGALKSDIIVRLKRDDTGRQRAVIGPDKDTAHVANWVEYGHRGIEGGRSTLLANGKTKGPGQHTHDVPEHPFIRPAWESVSQQVSDTICTTLVSEVEAAAARKGTT